MESLRETLSSEITGLKSLLRLNADGVGDDDDLVAQLTRTRIALEKFSTELLGSTRSSNVITPDTLPSSLSSSPTRLSIPTSTGSSTTTASLDHPSTGAEVVEDDDDAFLRLSSLLAGLQAQAEAAVSAGFSTSAPTTPSLRGFADSAAETDKNTAEGGDGVDGGVRQKCELMRTLSLPHPFLAPAPQRPRKTATIGVEFRGSNAKVLEDGNEESNTGPCVTVRAPDTPCGMPPTPPPSLRGRFGVKHRLTLSGTFEGIPSDGFDRRNSNSASLLPEGSEIDGLLTELLDTRENVDGVFRWVWVYLLGGGLVWVLVGWVLGWGCAECECVATR